MTFLDSLNEAHPVAGFLGKLLTVTLHLLRRKLGTCSVLPRLGRFDGEFNLPIYGLVVVQSRLHPCDTCFVLCPCHVFKTYAPRETARCARSM